MTIALAAKKVSKRFGGAPALQDVSVEIGNGTVHALVGENGAGKSTLGRILAGALAPDSGEIERDGQQVRLRSPRDAHQLGIAFISQEIAIVPAQTVLENVFLGVRGRTPGVHRSNEFRTRFSQLCTQANFDLPADTDAGRLTLADQQKVEILRALARRASILVMDEPTASLGRADADSVVQTVRQLRESGLTVIYVSHFLQEILAVSDVITILRDGMVVRTAPTCSETPETIVHGMVGDIDVSFPALAPIEANAPTILEVYGLSRPPRISEVSLTVRKGEIVALAGLVGSGRSEICRAIYGADRRSAGQIRVDGVEVDIRSPQAAVRAGIGMLPESRKDQGLVMGESVGRNLSLTHVAAGGANIRLVRSGPLRRRVGALIASLRIAVASMQLPVRSLSGGNQQKVVLGKFLFDTPKLLIADEPTRGVDVASKRAIYDQLRSLAAGGLGILLVSSEIEEVLGLSHRILVVRSGGVVGEFETNATPDDEVIRVAFGASEMASS